MSIGQMVQQSKLRREAESAGQAAIRRAKGVTEVNKLAGLQVPDLGATKDLLAQREASAISTLQQDARTALGGTIAIERDMAAESAKIGEDIAKSEYERDKLVRSEDADIEKRRAERELAIAKEEYKGAGLAAKDAEKGFATAAESAISLGGVIGEEIPKIKLWR